MSYITQWVMAAEDTIILPLAFVLWKLDTEEIGWVGEKTEGQIFKKAIESERKREDGAEKGWTKTRFKKKERNKKIFVCLFRYYCPWPEAQYPKGKCGFMLILQPSQSHPYHHRHQLPERNCNGVQGKEIITTGAKHESSFPMLGIASGHKIK